MEWTRSLATFNSAGQTLSSTVDIGDDGTIEHAMTPTYNDGIIDEALHQLFDVAGNLLERELIRDTESGLRTDRERFDYSCWP